MDSNVILSTGSTAILCSMLLQWLKNTKLIPFLGTDANYEKANLFASAIIAGIASLGIQFAFDWDTGKYAITGDVATLAHGLWHWVTQFAVQHGFYKGAIVPVELAVKNGQLQREILEHMRRAQEVNAAGYARVIDAVRTTKPIEPVEEKGR